VIWAHKKASLYARNESTWRHQWWSPGALSIPGGLEPMTPRLISAC